MVDGQRNSFNSARKLWQGSVLLRQMGAPGALKASPTASTLLVNAGSRLMQESDWHPPGLTIASDVRIWMYSPPLLPLTT